MKSLRAVTNPRKIRPLISLSLLFLQCRAGEGEAPASCLTPPTVVLTIPLRRISCDEVRASNFTVEVASATPTMAPVVGVGVGTNSTPFQTYGRQAFLRGGPGNVLKRATSFHADVEAGRWAVVTRHGRWQWEVIVEPDADAKALVVVTAYPIEGK